MIDLKQRRDGSYDVWIDAIKCGRVWKKNDKWRCTGGKYTHKLRRHAIQELKVLKGC